LSTQLYTYSLIRSLYDQGHDIIDSFWPLVINVLPQDKSPSAVEKVQAEIEKNYGLNIPQYSLSTIITRASRKGFIARSQKAIALTQDGLEYFFQKIEPEREAKRRVNELLEDAKAFMSESINPSPSPDAMKEMIQGFVLENLETLGQFFTGVTEIETTHKEFSTDAESVLLDYFAKVEKTNPRIFQTLQDIVCGSVISAIVHTRELFQESGKRFDKTIVFLDSNYVFSLLNMRYEEENKPAQELFKLMKDEGNFDFKVFDFTLHEITSLLKNYEKEERYFQPHIKVRNSLFASLKARGWSAAKIREFLVNVEVRLWNDLGVSIAPTDINLGNYSADDKRRALLAEYKPHQAVREQNHDLAAIDYIKVLRRKEIKRIERCHAMFLTSDLKLALFNYIGEEHKDKDSISEVIPDRLLTNILWLKNPAANDKLSLDSIIANYSRNLFVDEVVWKRFYTNVAELRSEGSLEDKEVSILLFDRHIQEVLSDYDPEEAAQIDLQEILRDIERIREAKPQQVEVLPQPEPDPVANVEREEIRTLIRSMQEQIDLLKEEKNDMALGTIERWKKVQELDAERSAHALTFGVKGLSLLATVLLAVYGFRPVADNWTDIEPIVWLITLLLGIGLPAVGIKLDVFHWSSKLYARIFNLVLRRKLRNLAKFELTFAVDTESDVQPATQF
jgi:hypothetical protein